MDIFAGPGLDRNPETGEVVVGSPLLALNLHPSFRRFIFIDVQNDNTRQLRELAFERRLDNMCHILTGDCNSVIDGALDHVPHDGATFCFVDPPGIDVHWKTIQRIASHKANDRYKVELFILFAYDMDLVRFLVGEGEIEDRWGLALNVGLIAPCLIPQTGDAFTEPARAGQSAQRKLAEDSHIFTGEGLRAWDTNMLWDPSV